MKNTLHSIVDNLLSEMHDDSKIVLKETPKKDLIKYHHTFGQYIRNKFNLWNEKHFDESGKEMHPDDVSMKIIEEVWSKIQ